MSANKLLDGIRVANIGVALFAESIAAQDAPVVQVDWRPPAGGNTDMLEHLDRLTSCDAANDVAIERLQAARPVWVDVGVAINEVPGMGERTLLHAGPPITWEHMSGPLKGAMIGAILLEGWAQDAEAAEKLCASGEIIFEPCHHHSTVGPMAGVVSPSMPVSIIENRAPAQLGGGGRAYCTLNEGLGKVLRYGAYSPEVLTRLRWMAGELAPALRAALEAMPDGLDIKNVIARALQMGDEAHNRNVAATSTVARSLMPHLAEAVDDNKAISRVAEFLGGNDHFFLNLAMPAAKVSLDAIAGVEGSSLVYAMSRNGTDFGIRVAGLGDAWFTAPAKNPVGLFFPGYSQEDANPDIGDSAIMETLGVGGFAMAAAPAIVEFVGGSTAEAFQATNEMYGITWTRSRDYTLPVLDFAGVPTGVDVRKVIETGIYPVINTGIAHKDAGVGQIGAGVLRAPEAPFQKAFDVLVEKKGD